MAGNPLHATKSNFLMVYGTQRNQSEFVGFIYVMRFRKPWLRVKSVNFDFSVKLSSYDYNEANKPNPKSLAHVGSEKSLVEFEFQKMSFFFFFKFISLPKSLLFTPSHT